MTCVDSLQLPVAQPASLEACLPDLLREQVAAHPERSAVVHADRRLTFRELAAASGGLAGYLRRLGAGPDGCIGLFVEPSIDLMVGAWGILMAGAAYLPLSPEYPEERLRYMIEDSRTSVIVAQAHLAARLAELAPPGTTIVTTPDATAPEEPTAGPRPEHLAYVIYTSGSTGRPKGVMIEHRSIVSQLRWLRSVYRLDHERTVLQKTPMSFDAAQWEILAPACGCTVVVAPPGGYRDPMALIETIRAHDVTTLQGVPTLLQALLDTDELAGCKSLTQIFSGGEVLTRELAQQCLATLPWCELVNLYGPTECTINSSAFTVDSKTAADGPETVSIGSPVHDSWYHILDDRRMPVGPGEGGELYIGGIQLARGYLHRPDLTAASFVADPFRPGARLYRTGDLARWNADGTVQFAGRRDNQVKVRGARVELGEIEIAINTHDWVRNAAVVVRKTARTGSPYLAANVELNPREAALMDQGSHGAHHQSKQSRLQVRAQLSNPGSRDAAELVGKPVVALPGRTPTPKQRRRVFARKTYRFFEGGAVTKADLLRLLGRQAPDARPRELTAVTLAELGELLRYFGQFVSEERLLPKYGYASPGALYAVQLHLELAGVAGLRAGYYYYHPVRHQLVLIGAVDPATSPRLHLHLVGKRRAIEPVYRNNIQEVLEMEAGHLVGLFEEILPGYGLDIRPLGYTPAAKDRLECADEDIYLGTFEVTPFDGQRPTDPVEMYVQAHPGRVADLPAGQYRYRAGELTKISDRLIEKRHIIAINQEVYQRANVGITLMSRTPLDWLSYVDLGRALQRLQLNDLGLGFMSSGYSSKTGHDLPSARRVADILADLSQEAGPSYFCVGGRVSAEQVASEGMAEDIVHMRGPAEMIKDDLAAFLPAHMMPDRVTVLDRLPLTANGKVDRRALVELPGPGEELMDRPAVPPRTETERRVAEIWRRTMKQETVSVRDDFFASGGNSLVAVTMINRINRELGAALPLQAVFESATIERLAHAVDDQARRPASRLVPLQPAGSGRPICCWPGLGGYPMSLRPLALRLGEDRPFYGVQAHGINEGEAPYPTIAAMAAADVAMVRRLQPAGPYTLWGYSFGARVAFEAAYQLEQAGERVAELFLLAPGAPKVDAEPGRGRAASFANPHYVTMLFSVFAGGITDPRLRECLAVAGDEERFVSFIAGAFPHLDPGLVRRVVAVVSATYQFEYTFDELRERTLAAPVTIFKASGDDYSFIEASTGYSARPPAVVSLATDHYRMLREPTVAEVAALARPRLEPGQGDPR